MLAATVVAGAVRTGCWRRRRVAVKGQINEDQDDLLMKAGLRNLLGVEDNRMAQKLEEVCQVSSDLERCMGDLEVKYNILVEELAEARESLRLARAAEDILRGEVTELEEERNEMKHSIAALQAKGAEHWAAQKAVEVELDKARIELGAAERQAQAATLRAEVEVKSARQQAETALAEAKEAKAEAETARAEAKAAKLEAERLAAEAAAATAKLEAARSSPPPA